MPVSAKEKLELFLMKLRYREGRLLEVEANKPFMLDDPASAWIVYSGIVNVFAVPVENGEPAGARMHLFRGEAGQLMVGIDLASFGAGMGLLVTGAPGTRVLRIRRARLEQLASDLEYSELVAELVNDWILGLAQGIARELAPRDVVPLEAAQETSFHDGKAVMPKRGVLWVKPLEGTPQFWGLAEFAWPEEGGYLPLSRHLWLRLAGPARLTSLSTEAYLQEDLQWPGLDSYHHLVLHAIRTIQDLATETEKKRLIAKSEADKQVMADALARLSSPLKPEAHPELAGGVLERPDSLLTACRLVGGSLDVEFQTYPGYRNERNQMSALTNLAKASRVRLRQVNLRGRWWTQDNGPMLGFWAESLAPIALLPVGGERYEVHDPAGAERVPIAASVAGRLHPFAYVFYRPFPAEPLGTRDLLALSMSDARPDLINVLIMGVLIGLLGLLPPLAMGTIFNTIVPNADRSLLIQVGLALLLVALTAGAFQMTRSFGMLRILSKMDVYIQAALWDRLLALPTAFFRNYTAGELGVRSMSISEIRRFISGNILTAVLTSLFSVFNLVLLFVYSPQLALVALVLALIGIAAIVLIARTQLRYQRELNDIGSKVSGTVLQVIAGVAKFRAAGAERQAFALWAEAFTRQKKTAVKARSTANILTVFNAGYPVLASGVIIAMVAFSLRESLSTGSFLAFNLAFTQFIFACVTLGGILVATLAVVPMFESTLPILTATPEVDVSKLDPGELSGRLEVSHVSFRYKTDGPQILRDVSLVAEPGEFVALVGPSGSGKSTLLRLLLGFDKPEAGGIYCDGLDLAGLDLGAVRRQIGVVLQSAKLMAGEIFANIVGSSSTLTLDDAWEAARMVGLEADIKAMPMGMNTVISEEGANISGGQRQRLLIARAIVNRPRILFFDEATSALDNRTQAIVSQSLENLQATRLVIAHRLSTIINADRIYVFEAGRIVQVGAYAELMAQSGPFAELAKRQLA